MRLTTATSLPRTARHLAAPTAATPLLLGGGSGSSRQLLTARQTINTKGNLVISEVLNPYRPRRTAPHGPRATPTRGATPPPGGHPPSGSGQRTGRHSASGSVRVWRFGFPGGVGGG